MNHDTKRGFTLIEILVVIGMLAILISIVLVAVNPLRQFAQARNSQRESNVAAILNAVTERIADDGGIFASSTQTSDTCRLDLPSAAQDINKAQYDLRSCIVPTYLSEVPYDPSTGSNTCTSISCNGTGESYDLGYTIMKDSTTNRVTVCAPAAAESAIASSTAYCLTR
jgi:type IV pilus assembly protein PilA